MLLGELPAGFETIHFRHYKIHNGYMRGNFVPALDGIPAIFGFADHHPFFVFLEQGSQMRTDHRVVIDQKNSNHETPFLRCGRRKSCRDFTLQLERRPSYTAATR